MVFLYKHPPKKNKLKTVIEICDLSIGSEDFVIIAGPCAVENEAQLLESARLLRKMGIKIMRAPVFKPRTSPYSFQGLGIEGFKILKKVKEETGIFIETEVMDTKDIKISTKYSDILRVGSRNMHNFSLLKELGKIDKPIILKRGMSATINELLLAAEYILSGGNKKVILCERGIRTFETAYRNTLDIAAVTILKNETHLPVIVDPSHAAGNRNLVPALSKAAVVAGADGLLIETHPNPKKALSDGKQSLYPKQLNSLLNDLKPLCSLVGKKL